MVRSATFFFFGGLPLYIQLHSAVGASDLELSTRMSEIIVPGLLLARPLRPLTRVVGKIRDTSQNPPRPWPSANFHPHLCVRRRTLAW